MLKIPPCRFHNVLTDGEADYLVQLVGCTICIFHLSAATTSAVQPHLFATRVHNMGMLQVCCGEAQTTSCGVQAKPHMEKSEVVDNETGKSQPSE